SGVDSVADGASLVDGVGDASVGTDSGSDVVHPAASASAASGSSNRWCFTTFPNPIAARIPASPQTMGVRRRGLVVSPQRIGELLSGDVADSLCQPCGPTPCSARPR